MVLGANLGAEREGCSRRVEVDITYGWRRAVELLVSGGKRRAADKVQDCPEELRLIADERAFVE
jgi:hypothetical protein